MDTLGERLRYARKTAPDRGVKSAHGRVTQSDVARVADVTRQAIVKVEKGLSQSSSQKLFLIADFLKVDPTWLITGNGEAPKPPQASPVKPVFGASVVGGVVGGYAAGAILPSKTVSGDELVEQIAAIHALSGQVLDNADKGRSNKRILKMLDEAIAEYQTFSVEE